jgi:arginine decarboxylase
MVVEKIEELTQILAVAKQMDVEPWIGVRVRLATKGAGKWATSGGEDAKFGLSTAELVEASELLRREGMAHCLKLVHFHVGSQIPDIGTIKRAVREAARFYAKLQKLGHDLGYLDVGGGLGIDYDGSRTTFDSSVNYSLHEYTRDVVAAVQEVCDEEKVAHPVLVSESGRAIAAHHSVLVVEAFGAIEKVSRGPEVTAAESNPSAASTASRVCMTRRRSAKRPIQCSPSASSTCRPRPKSKPSTGASPPRWWNFSAASATCPRKSKTWKFPSAIR